jgi:hypothetical protein
MTTTVTRETLTWRSLGFTEDINECDICGKQELKGTVHMVIVSSEVGRTEEEVHAGVVCAARRVGTTAKVIRHAADEADKAARDAWSNWSSARHDAEYAITQAWLDAHGLKREFGTYVQAREACATDVAAWDAANPAPARPKGW